MSAPNQSEGGNLERAPLPEPIQSLLQNAQELLVAVNGIPETTITTPDGVFTITKQKQLLSQLQPSWENLPQLAVQTESLPGYAMLITYIPATTTIYELGLVVVDTQGEVRSNGQLIVADAQTLDQTGKVPLFRIPWIPELSSSRSYETLPHGENKENAPDNYSFQAHARILAETIALANSSLKGTDSTAQVDALSVIVPTAKSKLTPPVEFPDLPYIKGTATASEVPSFVPTSVPHTRRKPTDETSQSTAAAEEAALRERILALEDTYRIINDPQMTRMLVGAANSGNKEELFRISRVCFDIYLSSTINKLIADNDNLTESQIKEDLFNLAPSLKSVLEPTGEVPVFPNPTQFKAILDYIDQKMKNGYARAHNGASIEDTWPNNEHDLKEQLPWRQKYGILKTDLTKLYNLSKSMPK